MNARFLDDGIIARVRAAESADARVMVDDDIIARALAADKTCSRVMAKQLRPTSGDLVGVRLNLNLFKSQKVAVQTIHRGNLTGNHKKGKGFYNGESIWYQKAVVLRDCYLNVNQVGREKIASGQESKFPMASCDGVFDEETKPFLDGLEVRFDPKRIHLFCDMQNRPVQFAERVTVYGHRVYCQGTVIYFNENTAPQKAGDAPSAVDFGDALPNSVPSPTNLQQGALF